MMEYLRREENVETSIAERSKRGGAPRLSAARSTYIGRVCRTSVTPRDQINNTWEEEKI